MTIGMGDAQFAATIAEYDRKALRRAVFELENITQGAPSTLVLPPDAYVRAWAALVGPTETIGEEFTWGFWTFRRAEPFAT